MNMKVKYIIIFLLFLTMASTAPFPLTAQEADDTQVEQSYSPDTVNLILIREESRSPEWGLKRDSLRLIEKMLAKDAAKAANADGSPDASGYSSAGGPSGSLSIEDSDTASKDALRDAEILSALEFLAYEGTVNKALMNNKVTNNHPDIRARAAALLGDFGGENAKNILRQMLRSEPETMVLAQVVLAVSKIGMTGQDESGIDDMMRRTTTQYPDNFLAMAFLDANKKYMAENNGKISLATREIVYRISLGNYRSPVKKKAKEVLEEAQAYRGRE
jgi:hypothetical protein